MQMQLESLNTEHANLENDYKLEIEALENKVKFMKSDE